MLKALLLDLDNTLLGNEMDDFLPRYFGLLQRHVEGRFPGRGRAFLQAMRSAIQQVIANTEPALTNRELFWQALTADSAGEWDAGIEDYFELFYEDLYQELEAVTVKRPVAAKLIEWALAQELQVVIATNPLYPQSGIEARLAWAGLPVERYPYTYVTHYGNVHATKPTTAYYEEILQIIGREPQEALMVGDDWGNDMEPAAALGLSTYWIAPADEQPPPPELIDSFGTLDALYEKLQGGWLRN